MTPSQEIQLLECVKDMADVLTKQGQAIDKILDIMLLEKKK